jgi:membrane-bound serine protease (ClpP class)
MADWLIISLLYAIGLALLIVEVFLPAHGLLGIVGAIVLGYAVYQTFRLDETAGLVGLIVVAVGLPTGLIVAVRNWHRTPVGRRISPPNPKLSAKDRMPVEEISVLIGRSGRAVTPLRPVGTCLFDGKRIECKAEYGMIERGTLVEAIRLVDRTLSVRPVRDESADSES